MRKLFILSFLFLYWIGCGKKETPGKGNVYLLLQAIKKVYIYDPETDSLFKDVMETGDTPNYIFFTEEKGYVVNSGYEGSPSIQVFNPENNEVISTYELAQNTNPWALTVKDEEIYITSFNLDMVYVFDKTGKIIDSIKVGRAPAGITLYKDKIYVACTGTSFDSLGNIIYLDSYIYVIEDKKVKDSIKVGTNSQVVSYDEEGRIIVLSTGNYADISGKIYIISEKTVTDSIDIGGFPLYFVMKNEKAYVVGYNDPLKIVDLKTKEVKEIISEIKGFSSCDVDEEGRVFVTKADWTNENFLYIIQNDTIINTVSLGVATGAYFVKIKQ